MLGGSFWGRDDMAEALAALPGYGFPTLGMNRAEADTDPRNLAAARLLERLGLIKDGQLRERWIVGGAKSDSAVYGLLRSQREGERLGAIGTKPASSGRTDSSIAAPGGAARDR